MVLKTAGTASEGLLVQASGRWATALWRGIPAQKTLLKLPLRCCYSQPSQLRSPSVWEWWPSGAAQAAPSPVPSRQELPTKSSASSVHPESQRFPIRNHTYLPLMHLILINKPHQREQPTTQSSATKVKVESDIYFPLWWIVVLTEPLFHIDWGSRLDVLPRAIYISICTRKWQH